MRERTLQCCNRETVWMYRVTHQWHADIATA